MLKKIALKKTVLKKNLARTTLAVLTLGVTLAGCGSTGGHDMNSMSSSAAAPGAPQAGHNQADVAFAQAMIPHHAQALDMAKLVVGHTTNAKVVDLAGRIQKAQDPEIQQMTGWLTTWGTAPTTTGDHSMPGMGGSAMSGTSGAPMTGMGDADMSELQAATGAEFDRRWLRMMTQHHQGAIDMAKTELSQGGSSEAKALAQKIIEGQQAEITEMKSLLSQG